MTAAGATGTSSAAKIAKTRTAILQAAAAASSDTLNVANFDLVKIVDSEVGGSVNISDVKIYSTPTSAIAEALVEAEAERESAEQREAISSRLTFFSIATYVEQFRRVAGMSVDDSDVADMLMFLVGFRARQLKASNPNWSEIVETLTLLGALERIYGRHLQLIDLKKRDEEGKYFSTPVQLYQRRADLVGTNADRGYFTRAAGHLDEAMRIASDRLGPHPIEIAHLQFETGLLQRDRGEYRLAGKTLKLLLANLMLNHASEKRWIAAAYKSLAIVQRDHHRNFKAIYNLWAAEAFEEMSELNTTQTKVLRKQQRKHLVAYLGFQLMLALPIYLILGLFIDSRDIRLVSAGALTALLMPFYLAYFDGLFSILVARWAVGPYSNKWPVASPVEILLLDNTARQFRTTSGKD